MQQEIIEAFEGLFNLRDNNKFNVAPGFFQRYAAVESDSTGKRFCDLKLHYKDPDSKDVGALAVPLLYIGSKNFILDYELEEGDPLLVVFSDRTLENWRQSSGNVPQDLKNPVKDSINHALAVPVTTVHYANDIPDSPVGSGNFGMLVKSGKKIKIGNGTDELLSLLNDNLTEVITSLKFLRDTITFSNGGGPTGPPTNGSQLSTPISNLEATQTALANIKA